MPGKRVTLHQYTDEILVEVIVDEGGGDVRTLSTEFDVVDPEDRALSPRGEIPEGYQDEIRRRIEDSGYTLRGRQPAAGT